MEYFREQGASVWIIGLPVDLLVGYAKQTALVEVKVMVGIRDPKPSKYTRLQKEFMLKWEGGIVATITDVDGARTLLATMRNVMVSVERR